jgi:[FeFe] hydrogenase H-cluster maturation GTPase HydF
MSLNDTPASERVHIGLFGRRNTGKSSLLNAITDQAISVVSPTAGTTTDPVRKAMELLPAGAVLFIDTPGIDDEGALGALRVEKARQTLRQVDVALLVMDASHGSTTSDDELRRLFAENAVPYLAVYNKCDLRAASAAPEDGAALYVSAATGDGIVALKERTAALATGETSRLRLVGDLVAPSDFVVLVIPIDKAAPKGRLILPQQQVIRDILEADAVAVVVKEFELRDTLAALNKKPALVVTDSQVFAKASADTPEDVPLTSFSILMARYKGLLDSAVPGARTLDRLQNGDRVLIAEGCTHHRQCDDIGSVKLPRWLRQYTGAAPDFQFTSGGVFEDDLSEFKLVIHCGGCMLSGREMKRRQRAAAAQGVPITNFGVAIAHTQGILKRSLSVFPHLLADWED